MKKLKKIANWLLGGTGLTYVLIIIFPQFLFANKLEHNNFSIYYHSNDVNVEQLKLILDKSEQLIKESDLYDEEMKQKLFLCNSFNEFTFFALLSRKAFAVNYPITQNIFLSKSAISENSIFRNGTNNNQRTLSGVIAHETIHSFLENYLGIVNYKRLPSWKNEGYCDFIANESSFDAEEGMAIICQDKEDTENPSFKYYTYRLYTNYIFQERNVSIDNFLESDFDLEELHTAIKKKYCAE